MLSRDILQNAVEVHVVGSQRMLRDLRALEQAKQPGDASDNADRWKKERRRNFRGRRHPAASDVDMIIIDRTRHLHIAIFLLDHGWSPELETKKTTER